jgi:uncharacterized protein YgiM (DUF1202 family)
MFRYFLWVFFLIISTLSAKPKNSFQKFTGKVLGNKVRVRTKADLDSNIITQLNKDDLVLVISDEDDFWAIKPSDKIKLYIFRSYILDNVVEASRVNIRLAPNVEAPIVGQLKAGDKIVGKICDENHKWLEIEPTDNTYFFISKEFVSYAGSPDYYTTMYQRKNQATNLLDQAYTVCQEESKMQFESMSAKSVIALLEKIINEYSEFSNHVYEAKKLLISFRENYLEKKQAYIEEKSLDASQIKDDTLFPIVKINEPPKSKKIISTTNSKDSNQFWNVIENSLYESWTAFNNNKNIDDFYKEQNADAISLNGMILHYDHKIQNLPGNFLLKSKDNITLGFLYSTKFDLSKYNGKNVKVLASPRPNNNFAYPAYFVLDIR